MKISFESMVWIAMAMSTAACERTHMRSSYGQVVREAYAAQVLNPQAGEKRVAEAGLDPEEANIVSDTYRKSLLPDKDEQAHKRAPIILVDEGGRVRSSGDASSRK